MWASSLVASHEMAPAAWFCSSSSSAAHKEEHLGSHMDQLQAWGTGAAHCSVVPYMTLSD